MRSLLIILTLLMGEAIACEGGLHMELGAGKNGSIGNSNTWDDNGSLGSYFGLRYEWDNAICQYSHYSQWFVGPPFNDDSESSLDHLGCAVRISLH